MAKTRITICLVCVFVVLVACICGCKSRKPTAMDTESVVPVKSLAFPEATITIFPVTVIMTGPLDKSPEYRAFADAVMRKFRQEGPKHADTLGLLLEEKGYDKFERADTAFQFPVGKVARKDRASAFGKFVSELDLKTDYALCTEFTLHIEESFQEVYTVIVDANGGIVWEDSQRRGDPELDEDFPGDELKCCELVCRRLTGVMGLDKLPKKELAEEKKTGASKDAGGTAS